MLYRIESADWETLGQAVKCLKDCCEPIVGYSEESQSLFVRHLTQDSVGFLNYFVGAKIFAHKQCVK